jgi:hypothetical protein
VDIASLVKFHLEADGFSARLFAQGVGVIAAAEKSAPMDARWQTAIPRRERPS